MAKQVVDEPGPLRPPLRTVRNARNSKHDVPCGENCLIYPKGKFDNTPPGIMGKLAQYLEVDLKTRPSKRNVWVERMGKRKRGGRHKECDRPNRFYPIDEATAENLTAVDAENVTDGDNGGVEDNGENRVVPTLPGGTLRAADEAALAWRHRDAQERVRLNNTRAVEAQPEQQEAGQQEQARGFSGRPAEGVNLGTGQGCIQAADVQESPQDPSSSRRRRLMRMVVPFRLARWRHPPQ